MQKTNRGLFTMLETYLDIIINLIAILISYVLTVVVTNSTVIALDSPYTVALIFLNMIVMSFIYHIFNMYRPMRYRGKRHRFPSILRCNLIYFGIMITVSAFLTHGDYRDFILFWFLIFFVTSTLFLSFKGRIIKIILDAFKINNKALKNVIIVGDNTQTAREYIKEAQADPSKGIMVLGYVGDKISPDVGAEKLGNFKDFAKIIDKYHPTDVVFAIDSYDKWRLIKLVNMCDDRCIKVFFLPVIYGFFKHPRQIEQLGSVPVINIHSTPLDNGANAFLKRLVDIFGSLALIILTAPIMLFAAIGVYISSPGPILFRQKRVGRLGKKFTMLKFRSMRVNSGSNDTWTTDEDSRKTRFGTFLRRTAIDELPQLFNVLGGSMSLVGPRPELPVFVESFKEQIPLYMVKHYVKPGITGLAQIKGLRGDTSVEDRIHADIEYIENWSFWLDIYILLKTPLKAFNKNEKYKEDEKTDTVLDEKELSTIASLAPEERGLDNIVPQKEEEHHRGKKILYVASTMSHIRNFHLDYIKALRDSGNEVLIMASGDDADFNIPFEKKMLSKKNKLLRRRIRDIVLAEGFDVVITHTSLAAFHVRLAISRRERPRIVNMVHGYLFSQNSKFQRRIPLLFAEKILANKTDALLVMNKEDLKIARRNRLSCGRVYFCRGMGVKQKLPVRDAEAVRAEMGAPDNFVLCYVAELSNRKNQRYLISAMPKLKASVPNIKLWLVGDGAPGTREELEALAARRGVSDDVVFLGQRADAADFINAADVYVSASKSEGLPFNLVEAMLLGKPTLASRVKGHEDVIENDLSGFLFELDRGIELAERVKEIYDGVKVLDKENIIKRANAYSYNEVFDETLQIMTEACDERYSFEKL